MGDAEACGIGQWDLSLAGSPSLLAFVEARRDAVTLKCLSCHVSRSSTGFNGLALHAATQCSRSAVVTAKIEGMPGDCAPLGFFDPLGFSKDASPETMKK